ncbi:MAG TPA: ATP-binding protein [Solirubrobacteraceae bacterium]|nr:ATP-binding protein [Solirubrobacteraceae bacterium]
MRLTLLYGVLFLASAALLLTIIYVLVYGATVNDFAITKNTGHGATGFHIHPIAIRQLRGQAVIQDVADLHQLLIWSAVALAFMAVVSVALGWLVAGRVLRPLRVMTATVREISARNLHARLAIGGPRDELKDLADTFDALLGRLQVAFNTQRRFVANASHELRTPLTLQRALIEASLSDPHATLEEARASQTRLLEIGEQQERLLEALLTLASTEADIDQRRAVDLADVTDAVLLTFRPEADRLGLDLHTRVARAPTTGDQELLERLVANLLGNAIAYNVPNGEVNVATGTNAGRAFLSVSNSGPVISPDEIDRLWQPFQRLAGDRTDPAGDHHGLGLSIVHAIVEAHHATITARPGADGGLLIEVTFPARTSSAVAS